ncbi:MAG: hypothetical protein QXR97_07175 [Thermoproteota archaeon]
MPRSLTAWANMLIDNEFHPRIRRARSREERLQLILEDFLWHVAVEGDWEKAEKKFIRYSLPMLLKDE